MKENLFSHAVVRKYSHFKRTTLKPAQRIQSEYPWAASWLSHAITVDSSIKKHSETSGDLCCLSVRKQASTKVKVQAVFLLQLLQEVLYLTPWVSSVVWTETLFMHDCRLLCKCVAVDAGGLTQHTRWLLWFTESTPLLQQNWCPDERWAFSGRTSLCVCFRR